MGLFVVLSGVWQCLGAYWLFRIVVVLLTAGKGTVRASWVWWVAPAFVVAVTAALLWTSSPLHLRFNLSQRAMDEFALEATSDSEKPRPDRVGLFPVGRVQRFDGGMRFIVRGAGLIDKYGFAYTPEGRPPNLGGEDNYLHLEGPWYVWEESW